MPQPGETGTMSPYLRWTGVPNFQTQTIIGKFASHSTIDLLVSEILLINSTSGRELLV
jgi:hypothetical protein